jgi:hypothetical protein
MMIVSWNCDCGASILVGCAKCDQCGDKLEIPLSKEYAIGESVYVNPHGKCMSGKIVGIGAIVGMNTRCYTVILATGITVSGIDPSMIKSLE